MTRWGRIKVYFVRLRLNYSIRALTNELKCERDPAVGSLLRQEIEKFRAERAGLPE